MAKKQKCEHTPEELALKEQKEREEAKYRGLRKAHRAMSDRHIVEVEAQMPEDDKRKLFHMNEDLRHFGNLLVKEIDKRLVQLFRTKEYRKLLKQYKIAKPEEKKEIGKQLGKMQETYGVTWASLYAYHMELNKQYKLPSVFALTRAEDVWGAVEKVLFSNGEHLHYRKRFDLPIMRAKQFDGCICLKQKNGKLYFAITSFTEETPTKNGKATKIGFKEFSVNVKPNDYWAQMELDNIITFLADPSVEKQAVEQFAKTGEVQNTFRPCYAALKCETIRGKLRVFLQITVEGKSLPKLKSDGVTPRHQYGKGTVGVDIGTQSVAVVSDSQAVLKNLAERNNRSTKESEALERRIHRYIDRSTKANNPLLYNGNGTIRTIPQLKKLPKEQRKQVLTPSGKRIWHNSKSCLKAKVYLKNLQRKNAENRHLAIKEDANYIRSLGDVLITEPSNAKALQRKAKKKKVSPQDLTERQEKRKRFGKSIQNRSPGYAYAQLKAKFESTGGEFHPVCNRFKASQYDHKSNKYEKKKLSQRTHVFQDGDTAQRDLYSAFLLKNSNDNYTSPDRDKCISNYPKFKVIHDSAINYIKQNKLKVCNSGIKVA